MLKHKLIFCSLLWSGPVLAQKAAPDTARPLREVIVTANKFEENRRHVAAKVEVLQPGDIARSLSNNTGGLLEQSGKVFVQRSQLGGGSPVLRGFEASRILLVVDGVRMNNAIYRTGHLQNVITIDDDIVDKVEILFGPASTIYGSDALGGIIHFQTRKPAFSETGRVYTKTNIAARYSSAYGEYTGHVDVMAGGKRLASLTSFSYSNFGDLRAGSNHRDAYGDFGKRPAYITQVNGIDSVMRNADDRVQRFSAYKQYDLLQKLRWQPKAGHIHELNLQYSTSSDIPRYDRLTDRRNGQLRWAEWYYGPQDRLLASYTYNAQRQGRFFDRLMAGASYQQIEESRMQRAYRNDTREHRIENIGVAAFHVDLRKSSGRHELSTGVDGQFNFLQSTAFRMNVKSGAKGYGLVTRYPDGRNNMYYTGAYAQHLWKIVPGKLILNDGLRVNYVSLESSFRDTAILHLPFTEASQRNVTFSANAGLIYLPDDATKLTFNTSTGFRAPNIDDLAKVFESAGGTQLVVPNPSLRPEQTLNFDLGVSRHFGGWATVDATAFYSLFRNAIVLDRFTLNGESEILYDGKMTPVVANQNKASASIRGLQAGVELEPVEGLALNSTITYTHGRYKGKDGKQVPMDHIPPLFGKTGVQYRYRFMELEAYALYNGWKRLKDYNPYGEDNQQYAPAEGMPAWYTLNFSSVWKLGSRFRVQAAVENILDRHYRLFSSGISSAGRNVVLKVNVRI